MKKIALIVILSFLVSNLSTFSQPDTGWLTDTSKKVNAFTMLVGFNVPINISINSGEYIPTDDFCKCTEMNVSDFQISSGVNISSEHLYGNFDWFPFFDSLAYGSIVRLGYSSFGFKGEGDESPRKVNFNGEITDLYERSVLEFDAHTLDIFAGITIGTSLKGEYKSHNMDGIIPQIYFTFGPTMSLLLSHNTERYSEIIEPKEYMYLDGSKISDVIDDDIKELGSLQLGVLAFCGFDWFFKQIVPSCKLDNLLLNTELGVKYNYLQPFDESSIHSSIFFLNIGLKLVIYDKLF